MLLNGEWQCEVWCPGQLPIKIRATVPGCLHTDLKSAGIIGDFYARDNAKQMQWVETCTAVYRKTFSVETVGGNEFLCFESLDVYAEITLNGTKIGETDDMFIPYRFSVGTVLQPGENVLEVKFRPPVQGVADYPSLPGAFATDRLYTRRMQCTYGWDWVARFVTMGICGDVRLLKTQPDFPESVYVFTERIDGATATVGVEVYFEQITGTKTALFEIVDPDGVTVVLKKQRITETKGSLLFAVPQARLWYPAGYGEQPLYRLRITVAEVVKETAFGIRTVEIEETVDPPDSDYRQTALRLQQEYHLRNSDRNEVTAGFIVTVNGKKIFCQGANWVPCAPFVSEVKEDHLRRLVRLAKDGGMNMLRVWGGGYFEKDAFYDECDRQGILVTQDNMLACGVYPEEDPHFIENLRREAETAAVRLRNHPCLVWWTGDNENTVLGKLKSVGHADQIVSLGAIGAILEQYDPHRRYFLSSPYGGVPYTSATCGTTHNTSFLWDFFQYVLNGDLRDYRREFEKYLSRFMDEQPVFGMSFVSSLRKFLSEEDIFGEDLSMIEYHCQTNPALPQTLFAYANRMAAGCFGGFQNACDRIRKLQILQCEWIRVSFELYRRNQWFSSGILFWMYNDCWPTSVGWSIVDFYGCPKPAYYTFKRCAKPVIASVADSDGIKVFVSVNGEASEICGNLYAYNVLSGEETPLAAFHDRFQVGSTCAASLPAQVFPNDTVLLCDIEWKNGEDRAFFCPNGFAAVPWETEAEIETAQAGNLLLVTCRSTVPYVLLDVPMILSDNCFFLKQGEQKTLQITGESHEKN